MRIGIDLGGTSVKAALCADDGAILIKQGVPTKTGDPDGLRADMKQLALALCASGGVQPDEVGAYCSISRRSRGRRPGNG